MAAPFITFEGGEGCGKTTQLHLLAEAMGRAGIPHIVTREPGGTPLAEGLRELLVRQGGAAIDPETELLLFQAARVAHVRQRIRPALEEGQWALCDRFLDSTRIYQGIGRRLGIAYVERLHTLTLGTFQPDLTILLDIAPEEGLRRAARRKDGETRFEELDLAFHRNVREGFLVLAEKEPERFLVIDAHPPVQAVHETIVFQLNRALHLSLLPKAVESA